MNDNSWDEEFKIDFSHHYSSTCGCGQFQKIDYPCIHTLFIIRSSSKEHVWWWFEIFQFAVSNSKFFTNFVTNFGDLSNSKILRKFFVKISTDFHKITNHKICDRAPDRIFCDKSLFLWKCPITAPKYPGMMSQEEINAVKPGLGLWKRAWRH